MSITSGCERETSSVVSVGVALLARRVCFNNASCGYAWPVTVHGGWSVPHVSDVRWSFCPTSSIWANPNSVTQATRGVFARAFRKEEVTTRQSASFCHLVIEGCKLSLNSFILTVLPIDKDGTVIIHSARRSVTAINRKVSKKSG